MNQPSATASPRTVIHIGLHKTATRFFQHQVFAPLANQGVLFNPPTLMPAIHALFRDPSNANKLDDAQAALKALRAKQPGKTLLISKPDIPGDMYEAYAEHASNLQLLHELFPEAHLVYVPRHPADWLLSAYRQSLVKGAGGPIETFLNFHDGKFQSKPATLVNGMRNLNALSFPVESIYQEAIKHYGAERVSVLCFEHVRKNKERVFEHFCQLLSLDELEVAEPEKIKNRSYSALAIQLFCGGNKKHTTLHTADEVPFLVRRCVHRPLRKLRANFIKHGWDSIIYKDWDLLARNGMRATLQAHYDDEYQRLITRSSATLAINS